MLYLLLKFPVGLASFIIAATLIRISGFCLTSLFWYSFAYVAVGLWHIDAWWEALLLTLIGIPLLFIPLHVMNFMAEAPGWFARTMLARLR